MTDLVSVSIESLRGFHAELQQLVADIPARDAQMRPYSDAWSIVEIIGHLGDAERVLRERIQLLCAHDAPTINPFDQDAAVRTHQYQLQDMQVLLDTVVCERQQTLALVAGLQRADFSRTGWHCEVGLMRVDMMLEYLAKHDYSHYRHIHEILRHIAKNSPSLEDKGSPLHA
jgi:uncharacterized damage-inducible protein DinB